MKKKRKKKELALGPYTLDQFIQEYGPERITVLPAPKSSRRLLIEFPTGLVERIFKAAKAYDGVGYGTLIRRWVEEGLKREGL